MSRRDKMLEFLREILDSKDIYSRKETILNHCNSLSIVERLNYIDYVIYMMIEYYLLHRYEEVLKIKYIFRICLQTFNSFPAGLTGIIERYLATQNGLQVILSPPNIILYIIKEILKIFPKTRNRFRSRDFLLFFENADEGKSLEFY